MYVCIYLFIYLYLSFYLSSIYLSIYLSFYPSIHSSIHPLIYISICSDLDLCAMKAVGTVLSALPLQPRDIIGDMIEEKGKLFLK